MTFRILHIASPQVRFFFLFTIVENLGLCVNIDEDLQTFLDVLFYLQITLSSVGILGSVVALVVCIKRRLRSSCCVQLACLSAYDVLFLLACLLIAILGLDDSWDTPAAKAFLCLRTLALWGATYTMLDICTERCLSVAFPFLAHSRFTVGLTLKKAGIIVVSGLCFTVPLLLDLLHDYSVGRKCLDHRHLTTFGLVYTLYISLLLLYVLPFVAIIVINVVFAVILCRLRRRSIRPKGEQVRGEQQLSVLVVGLSAWYVVSMLVPSLLFLVRLTRLELFQPDVDIRAAAVSDTIVVLSSCSNFVFYCVLWRPFRQVLWGWGAGMWRSMCGGCGWLRRRNRLYLTRSTTNTEPDPRSVFRLSPSSPVQQSSS